MMHMLVDNLPVLERVFKGSRIPVIRDLLGLALQLAMDSLAWMVWSDCISWKYGDSCGAWDIWAEIE